MGWITSGGLISGGQDHEMFMQHNLQVLYFRLPAPATTRVAPIKALHYAVRH